MSQTGKCVLVVSTDLDIIRTLSQALTLSGYAVTTATDLSQATASLDSMSLSVMLWDVKDLDRKQWERVVKLRRTHLDLSVVLLSSLESQELDRAVELGLIAGYLMKPFRLTSLEKCLERAGAERQRAGA